MSPMPFWYSGRLQVSTKALPDGVTLESFSMRSKILSLELLHVLLKAAGPGFRVSEQFTYAIKHYLCKSLIENSVSTIGAIFAHLRHSAHQWRASRSLSNGDRSFSQCLPSDLDDTHSSFNKRRLC